MRLNGKFIVPIGAKLQLAPGTRVYLQRPESSIRVKGALIAQGQIDRPIQFVAVDDSQGVIIESSGAQSLFDFVEFSGGTMAVSVSENSPSFMNSTFNGVETAIQLLKQGNVQISGNLFVDCGVGIQSELKSNPKISKNRFIKNRKAALLLISGGLAQVSDNLFEGNGKGMVVTGLFPASIRENRFIENETALLLSKGEDKTAIEDNLFERNATAVENRFFSSPDLRNNRFISNAVAILNDRFGSGLIEHNLFAGNDTAIYNNRKSHPVIRKNLFVRNSLVLYSNYSSYPRVHENSFLFNEVAVHLDVHMSADFEVQEGSEGIVAKESRSLGRQTLLQKQRDESFEDFVDLSRNWWGEDTSRFEAAGAQANFDLFFDRLDMPEVEYEGYEGKNYALDRVLYSPWLRAPVNNAGPLPSRSALSDDR